MTPMESSQSCSLVFLSCSNHKQTERQHTFSGLKSLGARSIDEYLSGPARDLLFDRRQAIRGLLKGDAPRLYNADQKGGFRDERQCNRRLVEGPEFGGDDAGEAVYLHAFQRYSEGRFFTRLTAISPSFWNELPQSVEVVFVSALYGPLLWDEPIQNYDCHFADYQDNTQRATIGEIWGDALTEVLRDFLSRRSPQVGKIYELLSEAVYQKVFDWAQTKGVKTYHRLLKGVSGPDTLTRLATILAGGISRFGNGAGSYDYGWYSLPGEDSSGSKFGFEANIGDDETATREVAFDPEEVRRLQEELDDLKKELNESRELLAEAEREREHAEADSSKQKGRAYSLRQQVEHLTKRQAEARTAPRCDSDS